MARGTWRSRVSRRVWWWWARWRVVVVFAAPVLAGQPFPASTALWLRILMLWWFFRDTAAFSITPVPLGRWAIRTLGRIGTLRATTVRDTAVFPA